MSEQTSTDMELLAEIDWPTPCMHASHDTQHPNGGPAALIVLAACPNCPDRAVYPLCLEGWNAMLQAALLCDACGYIGEATEFLIPQQWL